MALRDWIPSVQARVLAKNGYALLSDLDAPDFADVVRSMEGFQAEFIARTRHVWDADFPIPGDALAHFSRQWEYPYAWVNLGGRSGRVLDAGSGITFFPFLLAAAGYEVECCDEDGSLGLGARFEQASRASGCSVGYTECSLTEMPFDDATFDGVACISVLEHAPALRGEIVRALARVLKPGGRLVLTCDVDLGRDDGLLVEDLAQLLAEVRGSLELLHPLDLRRPGGLLTSESFLPTESWRLPPPWRPPAGVRAASAAFRSIAILGVTAAKPQGSTIDAMARGATGLDDA
jgi:SAM-dependent methyltransferase